MDIYHFSETLKTDAKSIHMRRSLHTVECKAAKTWLYMVLSFISEESVCHITRDLFVAGTENVATGLQWLIAYMVNYPEVQNRCREVINDVRDWYHATVVTKKYSDSPEQMPRSTLFSTH